MKMWLEINLILVFSYLIFGFFKILFNNHGKYLFGNDSFKALGVMLLFPIFLNFIPVEVPLPPVVERQMANILELPTSDKMQAIRLVLPQKKIETVSNELGWNELFFFVFFLGLLIWSWQFSRDALVIGRMIKNSTLIKKYGNLSLYLCPNLRVPCSFWVPRYYFVLFPEQVLINKRLFTHALSHELQHHRQGDTKTIFILEALRALFYLNPFAHLWISRFHEAQELKCDKEVLSRKGYEASEYGNTLIDVVKINSGIVLNRTWAMASLTMIKRRIEMITKNKKGRFEWAKRPICIVLTMFLTWQTLAGVRNFGKFKTLSLSDAQELVSGMDSKIPIEVNESVLKWLNYFMGDPKGKAYLIKSLERMHYYKSFLTEKLDKAKLPIELLAVPLMESGYQNSLVSSGKAAGIWQFIPSTARKYGLIVEGNQDERLNVDKLTGAAIDYYNDLIDIEIFDKDWRLALIAYNMGEGRLARAIKERGTRNPWAFSDLGDNDYLAKVMAGIILLKGPKENIFSHPLKSGKVTSGYGMRTSKRKTRVMHSGLDLAAKRGTPILSPLVGTVVMAKFREGYGKSVILDHGKGIETRYHHLNDYFVKEGQRVKLEDKIGTVGSSGPSTEPHLHLEVMINGKSVNPEIFF